MTGARRAWEWLRTHALQIYAVLAVLYILIPIFVIAVFSFGATPKDKLTFGLDHGFTTEYWRTAFSNPQLNDALMTSLKLALLATAISTVIGTLMAIALVRHRFRGRRVTNLLIVIPMATPEVVIGASLLSMFIYYTFALGFGTLLTFIPASGDYINAQFLGSAGNQMIGNVVQSLYLKQTNYPSAAALSVVLMAAILIIVLAYIRFAGSEALMGEEAR